MRRVDLSYSYPSELVATEPRAAFRTMLVEGSNKPRELNRTQLLELPQPGDVIVINDTRVEARRVFAGDLEIVFAGRRSALEWEVLFPAREHRVGDTIALPGTVFATLIAKGLPQVLRTSMPLTEAYFERFGEMALPPYIQKARDQRHATAQDQGWYQTAWAKEPGSAAAPTASLHFGQEDLEFWRQRGVLVCPLTLNVGLGTFLPVKVERLEDHPMHQEYVRIPGATWQSVEAARQSGARIWALGTTVVRSLEAAALGHLEQSDDAGYAGNTRLLIQPGHDWRIVSGLMTNFHQPESTLLALVAAFAGLERTLKAYEWAIERRFRLFSYGDFSVWTH